MMVKFAQEPVPILDDQMKKVSVILPALNEEETIGKIIDEIPKTHMETNGYDIEILVVDNGSIDRTRKIAEEKGAAIITEPRKGKGNAIRRALESVNGDFVFILDADYTYPATYIPQMLGLLEIRYDVLIGSRLKGEIAKGAMKKFNFIGNHLLTLMANILYGTRISDLLSGYWGFRREVANELKISATGFELEADMFIDIIKKGYRIGEIPIRYRRRVSPSKLGCFKDGLKIGYHLLKKRFS